jgi:hypothetical protein
MFEWLEALGSSGDADGTVEETDPDHVGTVDGGNFETDRDVYRFVDEEAGVAVYALLGGQSAGLSTVPLEDTDLDADEEWGSGR